MFTSLKFLSRVVLAGVLSFLWVSVPARAADIDATLSALVSDLDAGVVDLTDGFGNGLAVNLGNQGDQTVQDITFLSEDNFAAAGGSLTIGGGGVAFNNPDTVASLVGTDADILSSPDGNGANDVLSPVRFGQFGVNFPTEVGQQYRAQIFLYEGIGAMRSTDVLVDGVLVFDDVTTTFDVDPSQSEFRLLQIDLTATGPTTTIGSEFGSIADGNPSWTAVSLTQVPEPAAATLLILSAVGMALGRSRR